MPNCAVKICKNWNKNTSGKNISFHKFPNDENLQKLWIDACGAENINIKNARICSVHFDDECFLPVPEYLVNTGITIRKRLSANAVPTKFLTAAGLNTKSHYLDTDEGCAVGQAKSLQQSEFCVIDCYPKHYEIENNLNDENFVINNNDYNASTVKPIPNVLTECNINTCSLENQCVNTKRKRSSSAVTSTLLNTDAENNSISPKCVKEVQSCPCKNTENFELHEKYIACSQENKKLKLEIKNLNKKARLREKCFQTEVQEKVYEILSPIFTSGQIKKLLHPNKTKVKWTGEDIASAIALRSVSPRGYRYLRKKSFPLPGLSTLRKWAAQIQLNEGVLDEILQLMKKNTVNFSEINRLCVLSFDEIYISQNIEIEKKNENRVGPHKTCQLGMVRGLFSRWKQPIFYKYDEPLTENILYDVIGKLYDVGYIVIAVTTDLGSKNVSLRSSLNIGIEKGQNCWFSHPRNNKLKIFIFSDPPHLLKLIRNHFIDSGFIYNNILLTKECLEEIISYNTRDLKITFKLERKHLDAKGAERQRVCLAAQVFSNTTGKAIEWFGLNGFLKCDFWQECSELFKLVNDWFDLFNSKQKFNKNNIKNAYGLDLELQNETLHKMNHFMKNMRVRSHKSLLPFQKGILTNNQSLQELFIYLRENYNSNDFTIEYILTNRINQDVVENFFSYIRAMGAAHDKPSALQFKYRLKWFILGKHSANMFIDTGNTEDDNDETLFDASEVNNISYESQMKEILDSSRNQEGQDFISDTEVAYSYDQNDEEELDMLAMSEHEIVEEVINEEALLYIAGYVTHRFRIQYPFLGNPTNTIPQTDPPYWITHVSRGNLMFPSEDLSKAASIMEKVFNNFHTNYLSNENLIFTKVTLIVMNELNDIGISIALEVISCLVRTRTYIRLRELNKKRKKSYDKIRVANRVAKTQKFYT